MKPNNFFYHKCTKGSFFRLWVAWLAPYHKLTAREQDVMARVLFQYFKIMRKTTTDPSIINELLWTQESRKDMRESLQMSQAHFQIILGKLRKNGVLREDKSIEPRYIPHLSNMDTRFFMQICFDWSDQNKSVDG